MTFREKWEQEHPGEKFNPYILSCPSRYGYEDDVKDDGYCAHRGLNCPECWDREIPEERGCIIGDEKVEHPDTDLPAEPTIKDSGSTTEFKTGAHRDAREGKGRCDLMPLRVVAEYIRRGIGNPKTEERYWFFENIARFQETNNTEFLYCAMASFEPSAFEYTTTMFFEVSKHFEDGAKKYGENNWQKGIPTWCYIDSALRHYLKWLDGWTDEPHARAVIWNLMCCIWEVDYSPRAKEDTNDSQTS